MSEAMTYKLPPLPSPGEALSKWAYDEHDMQAYAIAAIEVQGVPDGWQLVRTDALKMAIDFAVPAMERDRDSPSNSAWMVEAADRNINAVRAMLASAPPAPQASVAQPAQMSQPNRLIAYSAANKLRELGYAWNEKSESWEPSAKQAKPQPLSSDRDARIAKLEREIKSLLNLMAKDRQTIAELEQRNRDLYEDVQRFKEHALSEKDARMALERELAEARKDAERWRTFLSTRPQSTHEVIIQAIDDAAMRKGQS